MLKFSHCHCAALCCLALLTTFATQASAQTWQKQGRASLPVVTIGSACNAADDSIGLTADRIQLLTCQSGVWKKTGGTAGIYCSRSSLQGAAIGFACFDGVIGEEVIYVGAQSGRYIVARKTNEYSYSVNWGYARTFRGATNANDGRVNMPLIPDATPAIPCANLGSVWYLPAINELNSLLYPSRAILGMGSSDIFWSSTETNATQAYYQWFGWGSINTNGEKETDKMKVRCIRSF